MLLKRERNDNKRRKMKRQRQIPPEIGGKPARFQRPRLPNSPAHRPPTSPPRPEHQETGNRPRDKKQQEWRIRDRTALSSFLARQIGGIRRPDTVSFVSQPLGDRKEQNDACRARASHAELPRALYEVLLCPQNVRSEEVHGGKASSLA